VGLGVRGMVPEGPPSRAHRQEGLLRPGSQICELRRPALYRATAPSPESVIREIREGLALFPGEPGASAGVAGPAGFRAFSS
jgi:hypothetical protein